MVTRPGRLPRLETARLMARLRALGVGISAIIVNAMTPAAGAACGACRAAARAEAEEVAALGPLVGGRRRHPLLLAPALASPPRAVEALTTWGRRWTRALP